MAGLYELMAGPELLNIQNLKALAASLKEYKQLLVKGLHEREQYKGQPFSWASSTLEVFIPTENEEKQLVIAIHPEIMALEDAQKQFSNVNGVNDITVTEVENCYLMTGKIAGDESAVSIDFPNVHIEESGQRALSIPIIRVLVLKASEAAQFLANSGALKFWVSTGLINVQSGLSSPTSSNFDEVAMYFINGMDGDL